MLEYTYMLQLKKSGHPAMIIMENMKGENMAQIVILAILAFFDYKHWLWKLAITN